MSKQITVEQFAKYLIAHDGWYYWGNVTIHGYLTKTGGARYWTNYKGEESKMYSNLAKLLEVEGFTIPIMEELEYSLRQPINI